jgi:hypothetical protein
VRVMVKEWMSSVVLDGEPLRPRLPETELTAESACPAKRFGE